MDTKKKANKDRAILPKAAGNPRHTSRIDGNASKRVITIDLPRAEVSAPESVTKDIQRQTVRAFLDAVNIWGLNDADSARLVGAEPASAECGRPVRLRSVRRSLPA